MLQTAASCDVCIALQQCSAGRNHGRPFNKLPQKWPWFLQMYREPLLNSSYRSCSTLSLLFPLKIIAFATFWTTSIDEVPLTTLFNFRCWKWWDSELGMALPLLMWSPLNTIYKLSSTSLCWPRADSTHRAFFSSCHVPLSVRTLSTSL